MMSLAIVVAKTALMSGSLDLRASLHVLCFQRDADNIS